MADDGKISSDPLSSYRFGAQDEMQVETEAGGEFRPERELL